MSHVRYFIQTYLTKINH